MTSDALTARAASAPIVRQMHDFVVDASAFDLDRVDDAVAGVLAGRVV